MNQKVKLTYCYAVRGTDSTGRYWMTRFVPGETPGFYSLKFAYKWAYGVVNRMNRNGANVKLVKQVLLDGLWEDDEA